MEISCPKPATAMRTPTKASVNFFTCSCHSPLKLLNILILQRLTGSPAPQGLLLPIRGRVWAPGTGFQEPHAKKWSLELRKRTAILDLQGEVVEGGVIMRRDGKEVRTYIQVPNTFLRRGFGSWEGRASSKNEPVLARRARHQGNSH